MKRWGGEAIRYVIVGAVSTAVHFATLVAGMELFDVPSVGLANFIAALAGSTSAFLGNRYWVFRHTQGAIGPQLLRFATLYLAAAVFHGTFLFLWSDVWRGHYAAGFVLATAIQIIGVYLCNRFLVFK